MGQYLKIPPRVMFLTQVWGTIIGTLPFLNVPYCQLTSSGAVVNYGMHLFALTLALAQTLLSKSGM